ncbi:MAG: ImmA/IrrE family metallo-endopeptidase, partial [Mobilitalea sp.]
GYFFLKEPPVETAPLLDYRTIDSIELRNPSRNLLDVITEMENIQEWMRDHLAGEQNSKLNFVGSLKNEKDPQKIAAAMREALGLQINWFESSADADASFKKLRNVLANIGIIVMMSGIVGQNTHRKLEIKEFRAFTLTDKYAPLIFINTNDTKSGKLFSILHEAAHIWFGIDSLFNAQYGTWQNINTTETICNAVAAEILTPQSIFVKKWKEIRTRKEEFETIINLASYFKCGTVTIARKALNNRYINEPIYYSVVEKAIENFKIQQEKKKESSGGDYYNTALTRYDHRFLMALNNSTQEGKTLYTDAYRLTNTNRKTFSNLIENVRGYKA